MRLFRRKRRDERQSDDGISQEEEPGQSLDDHHQEFETNCSLCENCQRVLKQYANDEIVDPRAQGSYYSQGEELSARGIGNSENLYEMGRPYHSSLSQLLQSLESDCPLCKCFTQTFSSEERLKLYDSESSGLGVVSTVYVERQNTHLWYLYIVTEPSLVNHLKTSSLRLMSQSLVLDGTQTTMTLLRRNNELLMLLYRTLGGSQIIWLSRKY